MNVVCFVDTETTGLDPDKHAIWEVALITPDDREFVWQFPVDEMAADPFALNIGHYWERHWDAHNDVSDINALCHADDPSKSRRQYFPEEGRAIAPSASWCRVFRDLTAGSHLCGAVPSFDEERLRRLLHRNGVLHRWHYHLIDVEALSVGYLARKVHENADAGYDDSLRPTLPWKSEDLSRAVGVDPDGFDRHTALGDARWAKAIYGAVMA